MEDLVLNPEDVQISENQEDSEKISQQKDLKEIKNDEIDSNFDAELNEKLLQKLCESKSDEIIKFTNPIRNYSHLLANRLVKDLIILDDSLKINTKQISKTRSNFLENK